MKQLTTYAYAWADAISIYPQKNHGDWDQKSDLVISISNRAKSVQCETEPIKQLQSNSDTAEPLVKMYENETRNESENFLPENYPFKTYAVLYMEESGL